MGVNKVHIVQLLKKRGINTNLYLVVQTWMQLYGRKKKKMVQAWMIDTSEEDQRTPHHRNPPQYISLEDLQKLGVLFYKVRYTR